jgi:hypothetical protein
MQLGAFCPLWRIDPDRILSRAGKAVQRMPETSWHRGRNRRRLNAHRRMEG